MIRPQYTAVMLTTAALVATSRIQIIAFTAPRPSITSASMLYSTREQQNNGGNKQRREKKKMMTIGDLMKDMEKNPAKYTKT